MFRRYHQEQNITSVDGVEPVMSKPRNNISKETFKEMEEYLGSPNNALYEQDANVVKAAIEWIINYTLECNYIIRAIEDGEFFGWHNNP